jgi:GDP-D-mannose dehydratase
VLTAPAGVNGQDGSYLVELLLTKGYDVVGAQRAPQLARAPGELQAPEL